MMTLERRIEALESEQPPADLVVVRCGFDGTHYFDESEAEAAKRHNVKPTDRVIFVKYEEEPCL